MKKIINIFTSISLITAGASSVVACGSHHNPNPPTPPTPPKSESQKLFDELNETKTPFVIKDDSFWGNESNYQNDLLTDLEQAAHITSQEDKNLLHDPNVKPLTQQDGQTIKVQNVDINIDGIKDPAIVKIKWELTEAQKIPGLFKFYTQTWPQETAKYGSNLLSLFYGGWDKTKKSPSWKKGDPLGWWKNDKGATINNHLPWDDSLNTNVKSYLSNLIEGIKMPISIQNMINVDKPLTTKSLDITKYYNIPLDNIYLLSHGVKYDLGYYASYDSTKALPNMQNWKITYDTHYNLMQNELKKTKWTLLKSGLNHKTTSASDQHNSGYLMQKFENTKYETFTDHIKFSGNFNVGENNINISYYGVDQDLTIKVEVLDF